MELEKKRARQLQARREELGRLALTHAGKTEEEDASVRARYALDTPEGQALYESFTDDALLDILREAARRLGHSPAQGEVYWVYRRYLRARFKNWPTALRTAGLSRAAGRCGKPIERMQREEEALREMLEQVRAKAAELGRTPHPTDLPQVCQTLQERYQTWGEVLTAAGAEAAGAQAIFPIDDLAPEHRSLLSGIRAQADVLNRAPLRKEVDDAVRAALIERCGSWRNALYQIGLEPVRRISPFANTRLSRPADAPRARHRGTLYDCHYRVLRLDERTRQELELVRRTGQCLGRSPGRRDIPTAVRRHLQDVCGSWSNALYQLELAQPEECPPASGGGKYFLDKQL